MTQVPMNPITEDDIANYLVHTPDFFERHAQLLASVHLSSPHSKRTVSLQERQAEMLRDKIRLLEQRIMEMIRNGNENLALSDRLLSWASDLFLQQDLTTLPTTVTDSLAERFSVPQVAIRVWGVADTYSDQPFALGVTHDARLFANSLREPFCGVNSGFEASHWLEQPQAASSMALLPLRPGSGGPLEPAFGMLVLASPDAQRFASTMGTDFLQRIADIASAALARLRW